MFFVYAFVTILPDFLFVLWLLTATVLHYYMYFPHKSNTAKIVSTSAYKPVSNCSQNHLFYTNMKEQIDA